MTIVTFQIVPFLKSHILNLLVVQVRRSESVVLTVLKWPQSQPRAGNIHVVGDHAVHADEVVVFQHLEQPERRRTRAVCYLFQNKKKTHIH